MLYTPFYSVRSAYNSSFKSTCNNLLYYLSVRLSYVAFDSNTTREHIKVILCHICQHQTFDDMFDDVICGIKLLLCVL